MVTPSPEREVFHLRLERDFAQLVREFARRTHRSLNGATTHLLEQGAANDPAFVALTRGTDE